METGYVPSSAHMLGACVPKPGSSRGGTDPQWDGFGRQPSHNELLSHQGLFGPQAGAPLWAP